MTTLRRIASWDPEPEWDVTRWELVGMVAGAVALLILVVIGLAYVNTAVPA